MREGPDVASDCSPLLRLSLANHNLLNHCTGAIAQILRVLVINRRPATQNQLGPTRYSRL